MNVVDLTPRLAAERQRRGREQFDLELLELVRQAQVWLGDAEAGNYDGIHEAFATLARAVQKLLHHPPMGAA